MTPGCQALSVVLGLVGQFFVMISPTFLPILATSSQATLISSSASLTHSVMLSQESSERQCGLNWARSGQRHFSLFPNDKDSRACRQPLGRGLYLRPFGQAFLVLGGMSVAPTLAWIGRQQLGPLWGSRLNPAPATPFLAPGSLEP